MIFELLRLFGREFTQRIRFVGSRGCNQGNDFVQAMFHDPVPRLAAQARLLWSPRLA
jgi:hypothetical protein